MKRAARWLGVLIGVLGGAFVVRELLRNREEVAAAVSGAHPLALGAAFVIGLMSMTIIGLGWHRCLGLLGASRPTRDTLRDYFISQLGKYLPGGIWPILGRAELARRDGVSGSAAYGSSMLSLALTHLAAPLTAAGALLAGAGGGREVTWQPVIALVPVGLAALHPWSIERVLRIMRRLSHRELAITVPRWRTSISLLLWYVPAWIGVSTATWFIASTLDTGTADFRNLMFATTLSWVVGFLAIGVPGGIGVREAVFITTATSLSSSGVAAAVSVVARVVFIAVDVSGAGVSALLAGRQRHEHVDPH